MSKVAIAPVFTIHDGLRDDFLARVRRQRDDCLANEPGCLYFDILLDPGEADKVTLYEVYADQAALEKHRTYPHYHSFKADTGPMVRALELKTFTIV